MKKIWDKIQIFIVGLFVPLWGILPIVAGIYGLCELHKHTPWLAILIFLGSLCLIAIGSAIMYGIGCFINDGLTTDEVDHLVIAEEKENK